MSSTASPGEQGKEIHDCVQRIRDLINEPRKQQHLLKDLGFWNQLCISMNVVEDSELAISAYEAGGFEDSVGGLYLAVCGLLQALFLQQDAVSHLCESLAIPERISDYPTLLDIREIRNYTIGHPTKREKRGQPPSHHLISRATLGPQGFQLMSMYPNGNYEFRDVSTQSLIAVQRKTLSNILASVSNKLEQDEATHKERFRMEKLATVFPKTMSYHFEKVHEALRKERDVPLAQIDLQQITRSLQEFREALVRRGIEMETYDSIKHLYAEVAYPVAELEAFFRSHESKTTPRVNAKTALIFAWFVEQRIRELREIAEEIDSDYAG